MSGGGLQTASNDLQFFVLRLFLVLVFTAVGQNVYDETHKVTVWDGAKEF